MNELEQQLLLLSLVKVLGLALVAVTLIYLFSQNRQNYFNYLLRSAVQGFLYGLAGVFAGCAVFVFGVMVSSFLFGTAIEYFYLIFVVAGIQHIFFAVGWIAGAVQESKEKREVKWRTIFTYITTVTVVSLPLTLLEFQQLKENGEVAEEAREAKWEAAIYKFGQSNNATFDFERASYSVINEEKVIYNIALSEVGEEPAIEALDSFLIIEMSAEGDIRNEDDIKREIQRIEKETLEENLREAQRELNQSAAAFYEELAEKHGVDPAQETVEPFLKELGPLGVRVVGDKFIKQVDYTKAENAQYGNYFHFEIDFQEDVTALQEKVIRTITLLDRLGWTAVDFIVFSDTSGAYEPVKICTMSLLEKERTLAEPLNFSRPIRDEPSFYDKTCEPMF